MIRDSQAQSRFTFSGWGTPAAGALSGLLFSLAFAPLEWSLLTPLALVPWVVALALEESRRRAIVSGVLFGLVFWCASIPWIVFVVTHYGGQSAIMGVVCLLLLAAILAQWSAIVAWGTVACARPGSGWRLGVFPLLWMAAEHARSWIYGGFPWNLTGHALSRHPLWIQSASVWGVYGLGLAAASVSSLLAASVVRRDVRAALAASGLIFALGVFGAVRLSGAAPPSPRMRVVVLQPNVTEEMRRAPGGTARAYQIVLDQARDAAARGPGLLVLPESALPVYWRESETLRRDLSGIAAAGTRVLFNDVEFESPTRYFNVARLLGPKGLSGPPYRKVHLVPFGEYVPLPRLFFFVRQVSSEVGAFSAAPETTTLNADGLDLGVGICYEILYPSLARLQTASGANLLATISNDSWYGRAGAQAQHFAGALLRSVENGRCLVRAAITGISGVVDEKGRIVGELPAGRAGFLEANVRLLQSRTAWTRWGYWIPRVGECVSAGVLLFGLVRWRRSGRGSRRIDTDPRLTR